MTLKPWKIFLSIFLILLAIWPGSPVFAQISEENQFRERLEEILIRLQARKPLRDKILRQYEVLSPAENTPNTPPQAVSQVPSGYVTSGWETFVRLLQKMSARREARLAEARKFRIVLPSQVTDSAIPAYGAIRFSPEFHSFLGKSIPAARLESPTVDLSEPMPPASSPAGDAVSPEELPVLQPRPPASPPSLPEPQTPPREPAAPTRPTLPPAAPRSPTIQHREGIELISAAPKTSEILPGEPVQTRSFLVRNTSNRPLELIDECVLPSGWRPLVALGSFTLDPGESVTRIASFLVPKNCSAGKFEGSFSISGLDGSGVFASTPMTFEMRSVSKVSLVLETQTSWVIAGDSFESQVRVLNQGNAPVNLDFLSASEHRSIKIIPAKATIPAGENILVTVKAKTSPKAQSDRSFQMTFLAKPASGSPFQKTESLIIRADIASRNVKGADLLRRIPGRMKIRGVSDGSEGRMQGEMRVAGPLDEKGEQKLNFRMRGPYLESEGWRGAPDEGELTYSRKDLKFRWGDQVFGLSDLTEAYTTGRGVGVDFRPARGTKFGAFTSETRWNTPQNSSLGFYFEPYTGKKGELRFNHLSKTKGASTSENELRAHVSSLEAKYNIKNLINFRAEYGISSKNAKAGEDEQDNAYRIEGQGSIFKKGRFHLRKTRAGPDFSGCYSDLQTNTRSFSIPLQKRLQFETNSLETKHNLDRRASKNFAMWEKRQQANLNYQTMDNWTFGLNGENYQKNVDVLAEKNTAENANISENAYRFSIGHSWPRISFNFDSRRGWEEDKNLKKTAFTNRTNYSLNWNLGEKGYVNLFGGFVKNASTGGRIMSDTEMQGVSIAWRPSKKTVLSMRHAKNMISGSGQGSYQTDLQFARTFLNGASLVFERRESDPPYWENRPVVYEMEYEFPFGICTGKKSDVGVVKGKVVDLEKGNKPGISRIILSLDRKATTVTGRNGEFRFPALAPGTYSLVLDPSALGFGRMTDIAFPLTVEVKGGETTNVEIGVVTGCQISGRVTLPPALGASPFEVIDKNQAPRPVLGSPTGSLPIGTAKESGEGKGASNILVEAIGEKNEVVRRVTDQDGYFCFDSLRTGTWKVKIREETLPADIVSVPEALIPLNHGEKKEASFALKQKVSKVVIVEEGALSVSSE